MYAKSIEWTLNIRSPIISNSSKSFAKKLWTSKMVQFLGHPVFFVIFSDSLRKKCSVSMVYNSFLANLNSRSRSLAICRRPSLCLSSVCLSSVTLLHPTQTIGIFGNIFTPFGTLYIYWLRYKILRRSSQGNPSVGGVKPKRGSQI